MRPGINSTNARTARLRPVVAGLTIPALIGVAVIAASQPVTAKELKLAHFMPPQHPLHGGVFVPLAKAVAKDSGGSLTIRIYPAGALGKGPIQQYKRAVQGVTDIAFLCHAFSPRVFSKTLLINHVGASKDAVDATNRLWDIHDAHLKDEFSRVKNLSMFTVEQAVIISRRKPVRSMADLKGAKVLTPGATFAPIFRAWGASPVSMQLGEMYSALSTGVVDMVAIAASALHRPWNLGEAAKHVSVGLTGLLNPCGMVMNKKSWASLTAKQKQILDRHTGRGISLRAAGIFSKWAARSYKLAKKDPKINVIDLDAKVRKELYDAAFPVVDKVLAKLEKRGISDARAAYKALNK